MYKQLDGVAMGSPLGTALASIFVDFLESRLFDNTVNRTFDAWAILLQYLIPSWFVTNFKKNLNLLHPASKIHSRYGAKQLLEFCRCSGREGGYWISYQHLQETNVY